MEATHNERMTSSLKPSRHAIVFSLMLLGACAHDKCGVATSAAQVPVPASQPSVLMVSQPQSFQAWLEDFRREAHAKGISEPVLDNAFAGMTAPLPQVVTHDKTQPEKVQTFKRYMDGFITEAKLRAAEAQEDSHEKLLNRIKQQYGVPKSILLALWHTESRFGKYQGHYSIVHSLATLAYDGRRSIFFRAQLLDALNILQREHMDAKDLKGSWAGAMGQVQFMPSSFLAYAVDFDGDGKRDIWTDDADALASIANYLHSKGWREQAIWGRSVKVPDGQKSAIWLSTKEKHTPAEWQKLGVKLSNGDPLFLDDPSPLRLIMPDNDPANAYLVNSNYDVIMDWNRSVYFATGVLLFADALELRED